MLIKARSIYRFARLNLERKSVARRILHVQGASRFKADRDSFIVACLIKDSACYVDEFVSHYTALGARHIVFIDNGSTDETVALASKYSNVSIFKTDLPFRGYEKAIRRYFLQTFLRGCWVLCVDADEHLDYPYSSTHSMSDLLAYLNDNCYTAVTACMLDMYSKQPFSAIGQGSLGTTYPFFDLSTINRAPYPSENYETTGNIVPADITVFTGGVRNRVLKVDHDFLLTKHPLMYIDKKIVPFSHPHYCAQAKIADFSCVLLHYKFVAGFDQRAEAVLAKLPEESVWAQENKAYVDFIRQGGGSFYNDFTSCRYRSIEDLSNQGLISIPQTLRASFFGDRSSAA